MLDNLIGDTKIFAIEYSVISVRRATIFGNCLIWLGGNSLGGLEGECYLQMICRWLASPIIIKEQLFLRDSLYGLSDEEIFYTIKRQGRTEENDIYYFLDTEGFDFFRNFVYRKNENFHFLWQLEESYWEEFKPKGVSTNLFTAHVNISAYSNVVGKFEEALLEILERPLN